MDNYLEALERGKLTRKKQDEVIALFITKVRNTEDMNVLEAIKNQLTKGEI